MINFKYLLALIILILGYQKLPLFLISLVYLNKSKIMISKQEVLSKPIRTISLL